MQTSTVARTGELKRVPNGLAGYESVVRNVYFPMKFSLEDDGEKFQSKAESFHFGPIVISRIYASGGYYGGFRPNDKSTRGNGYYVLNLCEKGGVCFEGQQPCVTKTDDLVLISPTQSFDVWQQDPAQSLAIHLPGSLLAMQYGNINDLSLRAVNASEGPAAILREMMLSCWQHQARIPQPAVPDIINAFVNLIGATFRPSTQSNSCTSLSMQMHFLRVRSYVIANFCDENLSADSISTALNLSKSYLFAIMNSANTTLGHFILDQRLERARQLLMFPSARSRSISEIAFSVGFQDLSHFSKRFSAKFGQSPKAFRVRLALNSASSH